jgi:hypothetical protein
MQVQEGKRHFIEQMTDDPARIADLPADTAFLLSPDEREEIALAGLRLRFRDLANKLPVLARLAEEQGITDIENVNQGAFLLFPHTVYKSYPLSALSRGDFRKLTRWLQGLTIIDLSSLLDRPFDTIDHWIATLNEQAGLQIVHTSGTSGKLSFLPRRLSDEEPRLRMMAHMFRDWDGFESGPDIFAEPRPVIYPSYRSGALAGHRTLETMARLVARDERDVLALYPEHFSADVAALSGRLRTAEQRGEQGAIEVPPVLAAMRDAFVRREQDRPQHTARFFEEAANRFAGRDVIVSTVLPIAYDWAEAGLARGMSGVFGSGSILVIGGGGKGRDLPENALETVLRFVGIRSAVNIYSMSEVSGICRLCDEDHYHFPPHLIPYVLDPVTGALLPRSGSQTGRMGLMDLFPSDHWGGFLSGDCVTVAGWSEPCACGRTGPYVENSIRRFSEMEGGDDKITCAGAPAAHDKAIEFLASIQG